MPKRRAKYHGASGTLRALSLWLSRQAAMDIVNTAVTRHRTRLILIGAAVLLSLGMGLRQSLGLFLTPVTRDLALTAADFTLAVAVQNIVWGASQAFIGALADRFGLRITMLAGALIYVAGLVVMATAR